MFYITTPAPRKTQQIKLADYYSNNDVSTKSYGKKSDTVTRLTGYWYTISRRELVPDVSKLSTALINFNNKYAELFNVPRETLYESFRIPKKKGGFRKIDAPVDSLKRALWDLKAIIEMMMTNDGRLSLYHTSAFAYIKGRSTIDAVKKHQSNGSRWFAKFDLHNFFGSTTKAYVIQMLSQIYPFCYLLKDPTIGVEFPKALDLAFLNGGLPQGTPISPLITNIIMIPFDFKISNKLRDFESGNSKHFTYTRYADDFIVSSKYDFKYKDVENLIIDTLYSLGAPFTLNTEKTRYGSSSGRNWNLGVMLNKDNEITVGHKKKKRFKAMLANFIMDYQHGNVWDVGAVMELNGIYSYYKMVEGKRIDDIVNALGEKFECKPMEMIKAVLKA